MINTNNNNLQPDSRVSILIAIIWEYNVEPSAKVILGKKMQKYVKWKFQCYSRESTTTLTIKKVSAFGGPYFTQK